MPNYANQNWRLAKNLFGEPNKHEAEQIFIAKQQQKESDHWNRDFNDMLEKIAGTISSAKIMIQNTDSQAKFEQETLPQLRELWTKVKTLHKENTDDFITYYHEEKLYLIKMFELINKWYTSTNLAIWGVATYDVQYPKHKSTALVDSFKIVTSHMFNDIQSW